MNAKLPMSKTPLTTNTNTDWRPPGWITRIDPDDEPFTPANIEEKFKSFYDDGYYTAGNCLKKEMEDDRFAEEARAVAHNRKVLRDAWNTPENVWRLAAALIGRPFAVDPFWNAGAQGLAGLKVKLDGQCRDTDGMLTVGDLARVLADEKLPPAMRKRLTTRRELLGDVPDTFPINWRQTLEPGQAPAAVNGPHSCTEQWLSCCAAYGSQEFCAAFVPDNGDGWFQSIAMTAALVVRLSRVPCSPPPGVKASSPRGASALCVWVPERVQDEARALHAQCIAEQQSGDLACIDAARARADAVLPEITRRVMFDGKTLTIPLRRRQRAGIQHAFVHAGGLRTTGDSVVDLGLAD